MPPLWRRPQRRGQVLPVVESTPNVNPLASDTAVPTVSLLPSAAAAGRSAHERAKIAVLRSRLVEKERELGEMRGVTHARTQSSRDLIAKLRQELDKNERVLDDRACARARARHRATPDHRGGISDDDDSPRGVEPATPDHCGDLQAEASYAEKLDVRKKERNGTNSENYHGKATLEARERRLLDDHDNSPRGDRGDLQAEASYAEKFGAKMKERNGTNSDNYHNGGYKKRRKSSKRKSSKRKSSKRKSSKRKPTKKRRRKTRRHRRR